MQITQLINSRGNAATNQFVINTTNGQYFQSYETLIAFKPNNGDAPVLTDSWDYSVTTLKHLKLFLGTSASKAQMIKQIESGALILDNNLQVK